MENKTREPYDLERKVCEECEIYKRARALELAGELEKAADNYQFMYPTQFLAVDLYMLVGNFQKAYGLLSHIEDSERSYLQIEFGHNPERMADACESRGILPKVRQYKK